MRWRWQGQCEALDGALRFVDIKTADRRDLMYATSDQGSHAQGQVNGVGFHGTGGFPLDLQGYQAATYC